MTDSEDSFKIKAKSEEAQGAPLWQWNSVLPPLTVSYSAIADHHRETGGTSASIPNLNLSFSATTSSFLDFIFYLIQKLGTCLTLALNPK